MKRIIKASEETTFTNKDLVRILNDHGIDTTKAQYELIAEIYDRFEDSPRYRKKFVCPGDYLAYFSLDLHGQPNAAAFEDYFGPGEQSVDELNAFVAQHPTINDIAEFAAENWWGDGDDYIISLKNLDTGKVLFQGEEPEIDYDEEDWED